MSNDSQTLSRAVIESVAGFIAGVSSTCVSHPLDIIKTRLQIQGQARSPAFGDSLRIVRSIARQDGFFRGFYRGLTPNVVGNSVSWALYFVWYDQIKYKLREHRLSNEGLSYYEFFLASGAAGALTSICTNPIWVIKTRMLSTSSSHPGAYSSIADGVRHIYRNEGLSGFYRGLVPSLFGVTHGALQFMAYEKLKTYQSYRISGTRTDLNAMDFVVLSSLAKIFAGSTTYPYQVVRARLQMYDAGQLYRNARDVMIQIWTKEGLAGFYRGLGPNLLRVLPSTWVTFLVYEKTKKYLPKVLNEPVQETKK